ncbi:hypothetical protein AXF42_Ash021412 [Apostasia shenzhenica]|uniref:Uncharacterized protein n=1 Tax=Apostasia shenzhenica TaxID=1088818 RepID=A0A2H9ZVZ4_9ASPA|nr:hypothetical protein AXF42_Ash021412 [Apostasia shenzhenica]
MLSGVSWDIGERGPARRHVYGQDAAQEPRVNISPSHCQGANIDMGPGMQTVARVDTLPKARKDKMGAAPADSYPFAFTPKFFLAREFLERNGGRKRMDRPGEHFQEEESRRDSG